MSPIVHQNGEQLNSQFTNVNSVSTALYCRQRLSILCLLPFDLLPLCVDSHCFAVFLLICLYFSYWFLEVLYIFWIPNLFQLYVLHISFTNLMYIFFLYLPDVLNFKLVKYINLFLLMQRKKSCQATTMDDNSRIKIKTFACSIKDTGVFFLPFVGRVWVIVLYEVITNKFG